MMMAPAVRRGRGARPQSAQSAERRLQCRRLTLPSPCKTTAQATQRSPRTGERASLGGSSQTRWSLCLRWGTTGRPQPEARRVWKVSCRDLVNV
jgi:hypothetical protein